MLADFTPQKTCFAPSSARWWAEVYAIRHYELKETTGQTFNFM